jgi:hypothetical protein
MICSAIRFASLIGIANPRPMLPDCWLAMAADDNDAIAELTPTTRPWSSTNGPPEFPGLMAASVWIASMTSSATPGAPPASTGRFSADTMPLVTVPARPSGEPTATTGSPTARSVESPSAAGFRSLTPDTLMTAMSSTVSGSPTIVACTFDLSGRITDRTPPCLAAAITWLFVMM